MFCSELPGGLGEKGNKAASPCASRDLSKVVCLGGCGVQWKQEGLERGASPPCPPSCLARVSGELTMTFPAGILRVFSGSPPPPVLSFRLVHTGSIEHFQPNADLLFG